MAEHLPSPSSLFNQLTAFSYEQDPDFALGFSDVMELSRSTKIATALLNCEDGVELPLYDEKKIIFRAERKHTDEDYRQPDQPNGFTIKQEIVTQLPGIPKLLMSQLDGELDECYDSSEPGDFNKIQFVEYAVSHNEEGEVSIDRNIGYALCDYDITVYEISETSGQPEAQYIALAHRQKSLRVMPPIKQDAAEDKIEQISYDALFKDIFDSTSNIQLYQELTKTRETDATISILGLVECLKRRWTLPDQLVLAKYHLEA